MGRSPHNSQGNVILQAEMGISARLLLVTIRVSQKGNRVFTVKKNVS
jgi:hypothetical protein